MEKRRGALVIQCKDEQRQPEGPKEAHHTRCGIPTDPLAGQLRREPTWEEEGGCGNHPPHGECSGEDGRAYADDGMEHVSPQDVMPAYALDVREHVFSNERQGEAI
eukprot:3762728-Prymnesium_polylepis.3